MKNQAGKFSFAIPGQNTDESAPDFRKDAGTKVEKAFDYPQVETEEEAQKVLTEKKWSLIGMVNDVLKANARSNAYQAALLPYRPSEVTPDEIKERMVRDYIRLGVSEDAARKQVEALLSATNQ